VAMIDGVLAGTGAMAKAEVDAAQTLGGNIYMSARKYEKARKIYADMLERNPADMVANNNMCLLTGELCAQPDFPTALDYSAKAYKAMTQRGAVDAGVLDTYGWTKCLAGQAAEGIKYLQDAVARQPSVERHYHLGEALLMLSPPQAPAALAALTKAREAVPAEAAKGRKIDAVLSNKIDAAMDKGKRATITPWAFPRDVLRTPSAAVPRQRVFGHVICRQPAIWRCRQVARRRSGWRWGE